MDHHMQLVQHVNAVTTDVRESYPGMNAANAIRHVKDTLKVDALNADDPTYEAYHAVLTANEGDLVLAVGALVHAGLSEDDVFVTVNGHAILDGIDAFEWLDQVFGEDVA